MTTETTETPLRKLNVGCGKNLLPGYTNLDISPLVGADVVFDLEDCGRDTLLPFPDDTFDEIYTSHTLEHIHNILPVMEELHRVAKPGCRLSIRVPYGSSDSAYEDPTHVRQFFLNSFDYFSQPAYAAADYGYRGDWAAVQVILVLAAHVDEAQFENTQHLLDCIHSMRNVVDEILCFMTAVKPIRSTSTPQGECPVMILTREELLTGLKQPTQEPNGG